MTSPNDEAYLRFRPRALLTEADAIQIYLCRPAKSSRSYSGKAATQLAEQFNVSPKAIRDIWNRRTWAPETRHLWNEGEFAMVRSKVNKPRFDTLEPTNKCQNLVASSKSQSRGTRRIEKRGHPIAEQRSLQPILAFSEQTDDASHFSSSANTWETLITSINAAGFRSHMSNNLDLVQWQSITRPVPNQLQSSFDLGTHAENTSTSWDAMRDLAADDPFHADWAHW